MTNRTLWVGCGAGFSGDRVDAALPVVEGLLSQEGRRVLIFETLAERTLALAHLARREQSGSGYEPLLERLLEPVLGTCIQNRIAIVGNFGAANPDGAARAVDLMARRMGIRKPRIAIVRGDDLTERSETASLIRTLRSPLEGELISANAYLGAEAIASALEDGADVVVTGRVADPSLTVGPALAYFGWRQDDWRSLGAATIAGHLLECGAQVTGGYFADPGFKDVPGLSNVGFPIAAIDSSGACKILKPQGTGGLINRRTVTEQLLYEIHDPGSYLTPDVTADMTGVTVVETAKDEVAVYGATGRERPRTLKVNAFYDGGWVAEGEISYGGPRAEARARLAADIVSQRLGRDAGLRIDLIGVLSIFGDDGGSLISQSYDSGGKDVRLRLAAKSNDKEEAERLMREVASLYTCGPAGGGGIRTSIRRRFETRSCLIERDLIPAWHEMYG